MLHEEFGNVLPRLHVALAMSGLLPLLSGYRARAAILRLGGLHIGRGTVVFGRMTVTGSKQAASNVRIGRSCLLNRGCVIDASAPVTIADRVAGPRRADPHQHARGRPAHPSGLGYVGRPVTIGEGAWIGARTVVLPGVSIGDGAVIGAGAVVRRDVPANTLVGGVPAQWLRHLDGDADPVRAHSGDEKPDQGPISWSPSPTSLRAEPRT